MSEFLHHTTCPKCGSSDNLAVYSDHEYCFGHGCGYFKDYSKNNKRKQLLSSKEKKEIISLPTSSSTALASRGLDSSSLTKYKVTVNTNPDSTVEAVFPRFNENNEHVGNQIRYEGKEFSSEGDVKNAVLFGQNFFPAGGRSVTVTEGYYDTVSVFQMTGSRYPNVGVQSASSAKKEVVNNFEYLDSFDEIVLCFDNDEPGQKAAKECAILFSPGKVRILKLENHKDASDYCQAKEAKSFIQEWFRAPVYMPDGLQLGSDNKLREEVLNYVEPKSVPYPWEGLNNKTYGIRESELVLLTADTGVGKTSVMKEIEYALLTNEELKKDNVGIGFLHLEEPKRDLALGLMSIHKNKPYHFPDVERTTEELNEVYTEIIETDRICIWDHFGSNDIEVVLSKIRHMAAMGCRYIMVDHLSIIVSDQSGDERKQLDEISTKIKTLTMNLNIAVFCVIHVNRQGQVRGSAGPEQVANIVIRLERDKNEASEWRRNITKISVEKNRKYGRTGPACYLKYQEETGRLRELDKDEIQEYEMGGSGAGNEF